MGSAATRRHCFPRVFSVGSNEVNPHFAATRGLSMVNTNELLSLPPAEQLRIIELLWDKLGEDPGSIPLPEWIAQEGQRRLDELKSNPSIGLDHETVWSRIEKRNG